MSIETDIKQKKFRSAYQRLFINLIYTTNWLEYKQMELFKEHDLTLQQYNVLRILRGQQPHAIKVSDIAERMVDKNSNTSRLIDKLLLKGLAERTSCPSDRRAVDVVITQSGLDLLATLDPFLEDFEIKMSENITSEEADQISLLLDKLRKSEND